ncbi:MAG: hypothetical protein O3A01_06010 [bacterium]|nr:hypothetical protein [bacterium]
MKKLGIIVSLIALSVVASISLLSHECGNFEPKTPLEITSAAQMDCHAMDSANSTSAHCGTTCFCNIELAALSLNTVTQPEFNNVLPLVGTVSTMSQTRYAYPLYALEYPPNFI